MLGENHSLTHEFPEHLDTITQLTANDSAFAENAKNYNQLDKEHQAGVGTVQQEAIEEHIYHKPSIG